MKLDKYRSKRSFSRTPEPRGEGKGGGNPPGGERIFVIQKHQASHLHYDLRLEEGGALKSWAVPKGPSLDPGEKRLAIQVEDHPLDYAGFEGTIPEGEYGAGRVILWDRGHFHLKPPEASYEDMESNGVIKLEIFGEKLRGGYTLVRTRWGGKGKNWLLIKERDDQARPGSDVVAEAPLSVLSGDDVGDG